MYKNSLLGSYEMSKEGNLSRKRKIPCFITVFYAQSSAIVPHDVVRRTGPHSECILALQLMCGKQYNLTIIEYTALSGRQ